MLPSLPAPGRLSTRLALVSAMLVLGGCVSMGAQPQLARLNGDAARNSSRAIGSLATETAAWPAHRLRDIGDHYLNGTHARLTLQA